MGRTACTESQWLYKGDLYLTLPFQNYQALDMTDKYKDNR